MSSAMSCLAIILAKVLEVPSPIGSDRFVTKAASLVNGTIAIAIANLKKGIVEIIGVEEVSGADLVPVIRSTLGRITTMHVLWKHTALTV